MRHVVRLSAALALLTALVALHPAVSRADCPLIGTNQICVDRPAVDQHATNTTRTFPAGSHVKIEANGCEQTGGSGETWKRYVNPDPWGTPTQYHGLAGIYSSTGGAATLELTRISGIQGTFFRPRTPSYLQVGFEDSDYSDNNYDDHDDGDGQCTWSFAGPITGENYYNSAWGYSGPAYILLTVNPNVAPSVTANQPAAFVSGQTTFTGSATDADADSLTYQWIIDGHAVSGATGASFDWNAGSVVDGSHTVSLEASDPYTSETSTARTFQVDNTSPTVAITSGPSNQTFGPGSTQRWTFAASDGSGSGVQGVQCRLDGARVTCSSASSHSVANLPNGTHTFSVQATDKLGHVSTVESRTFTIDGTPPETTVTAGPAEGASTTDTTVTYALASTEQESSFQCRVYVDQPAPIKPDFAPCSGGSAHVASGLSPAAYVFEAYATDAYGNADPTPVVRHFTVSAPTPPGGGTSDGGGSNGGAPTGGTSVGGTSGGGSPGGGTSGGGTPTGPTTTTKPQRRGAIHATLIYAYRSPTRLTRLTLKQVPRGSTVRVTCHRRCPKALHHAHTMRHVSGSLSLTRLVRRELKPGVRLSIVVSKPGWRSLTKTVQIRRSKPPVVH